MNTVEPGVSGMEDPQRLPLSAPPQPLHRLAAARRARHVSRKDLAARLKLDEATLCQLEEPHSDLPLSILYRCQQLLGVPMRELLVDTADPLALPPVDPRQVAAWLRSVVEILNEAKQPAIRRLAHNLVDQMVELAPELRDLAADCKAGNDQLLDSQGRATGRTISEEVFLEPSD